MNPLAVAGGGRRLSELRELMGGEQPVPQKLLSAAPTRDDARAVEDISYEEADMAKELKCSDVGMKSCTFVAQGKDEKEVMTKAAEHAKYAHGMLPPDVEKKARAAIREAGAAKDTQSKPFTMGPSKL